MAHLIYLTTIRFDISQEQANPYNPIAGQGLLCWLAKELANAGWEVTEPDAEDWGWYITVQMSGASYTVGASGEIDDGSSPGDWILQIHRNRTFMDKLAGRNKMADDDPLTREIESIARRDKAITKVEVEIEG